jgi:hypothetical protein
MFTPAPSPNAAFALALICIFSTINSALAPADNAEPSTPICIFKPNTLKLMAAPPLTTAASAPALKPTVPLSGLTIKAPYNSFHKHQH